MHSCGRAQNSGGDWVPGGGGRRTASGPGGSSAKAYPPGAQDYLVIVGILGMNVFCESCYGQFTLQAG